jgi:transcriptional regulator with XRE-family HTH domain
MDELERILKKARERKRLPEPVVRRLLREQAGLTQQQEADIVGCSRVEVTRWESGLRSPGPKFLRAYQALLDRLAREAAGV